MEENRAEEKRCYKNIDMASTKRCAIKRNS
jgi:hypothetical protein